MSRSRRFAVALLLLAAVLVVVSRPHRETLTERTHILCENCGLAVAETDRLIDTMRAAEGDRAALLAEFYATFGDGVVDGNKQCDPPDGLTCDSNCRTIFNPPIDGWLVSFHESLTVGGPLSPPLALYFCDGTRAARPVSKESDSRPA